MNKPAFQSCQQKWQQMPIKDGERWCDHCSQCVTDFRATAIPDIQKIHTDSSTRVCGVYTKNQINQLYPVTVESLNYRQFKNIAATVFAFLSFNLGAQNLPSINSENDKLEVPAMDAFHYPMPVGLLHHAIKPVQQDSITINGIIKDSTSLKPLIGASIWLRSTEKGSITNIEGFYELTFSPADGDSLMVSYFGYETISLQVASLTSKELDLHLIPRTDLDICIVGGIPPRYKIWQKGFWRRLFRKRN